MADIAEPPSLDVQQQRVQALEASRNSARNRNRLEKQLGNPLPSNLVQPANQTPAGQPAGGADQTGAGGVTTQSANQLDGQRNIARRQQPNAAAQKKKQQSPVDKDYPHPITLNAFLIFGLFAVGQDLIPLLFDIIGIGWIIEYIMLPITWGAYWYYIVRFAPESMKRKFWQRTLLVTAVGWIPFVGAFIPEWTATAIGAYIVIARYQSKKAALATARGSVKKVAGPAGAAQTPSPVEAQAQPAATASANG